MKSIRVIIRILGVVVGLSSIILFSSMIYVLKDNDLSNFTGIFMGVLFLIYGIGGNKIFHRVLLGVDYEIDKVRIERNDLSKNLNKQTGLTVPEYTEIIFWLNLSILIIILRSIFPESDFIKEYLVGLPGVGLFFLFFCIALIRGRLMLRKNR